MDISFHIFWVNAKQCDCWIAGRMCVVLLETAKLSSNPNCFVFPPAVNEGSYGPTSSLAFGVIIGVLGFGRFNRRVVESCCFSLHFSDDK